MAAGAAAAAGEAKGTKAAAGKAASPASSPTVETPAMSAEEPRWQPVLGLACQLTVDLPLPGFKVSDLLRLQTGMVVGTSWPVGHDVPLLVNGTLIGWSEFEVVGNHLAVRLTELA